MRSLIIGGTRNLGPGIVQALLQQGHEVAVFNRGQTRDDLPEEVERLRGDRTDPAQLKRALGEQARGEQARGGREFDLVIDTTLYTGAEAEATVEALAGRVGHYIFLSTGQVYLVRVGVERPFREEDYAGPVMAEPPKSNVSEYNNWLYGNDKRAAEDVFTRAWAERQFPFTSLRLPMVNSERDHFDRIYGYFLRLQDGGPIIIPGGDGISKGAEIPEGDGVQESAEVTEGKTVSKGSGKSKGSEISDRDGPPLRHVYGEDVVRAILRLAESDLGKGRAYNIGQDETLSLEQFLEMLAALVHRPLKIVRVPRQELEREGLLPDCSPFSGRWMSSLENTRSKEELGIAYTPVSVYLKKLVSYFQAVPARKIEGYSRRTRELELWQSR